MLNNKHNNIINMENNDLLEMVRSKAQGWLTKSYDAETRAQVQALLDNEDSTELIECFYKDLEIRNRWIARNHGGRFKSYEYIYGWCGHPRFIQLSEKGICGFRTE